MRSRSALSATNTAQQRGITVIHDAYESNQWPLSDRTDAPANNGRRRRGSTTQPKISEAPCGVRLHLLDKTIRSE